MSGFKKACGVAAAGLLAGASMAWGTYTGTGTFTKITSRADLTDGYYIIASSNGLAAMTHTNTSSYFTNVVISPVTNTLVNPSGAIVWLIQTNATYGGLTLFNEASNRYVAYSGSANAAYVAAAVNGTTGVWNFTYASNSFMAYCVATNTRALQYNSGAPRFACYTTAQQKLALYKMSSTAEAPSFTSGTSYGATSLVAMAFTVTASGSPTPTLALQSQTASSGFGFSPGTGVLNYTPPPADGGATQTFTFTASNSAGVATQTVSVAVTAAAAPSFTSGTAYGATSLVAMAFTVTASGTPAPALALQSEDAAGSTGFTPGTGVLNYTPATNDVGTRTFTFTASNVAGVATQSVSVTVVDMPVAPSFTSGTSYGATALVAMAFTVVANGNPPPTLTLRSQTASSGFGFTPATGALDYTPPTNDVGTRTFTFTASNSAGVATQTVSVAVAAAPTAIPTVSITNITTNSFTVNWTACTGATNYQVQVATDTNFTAGGGGGSNLLAEAFASLTDTAVPSGWTTDKSSDLDYTGEPYVGAAAPAYKFGTTGQWLQSPAFATGATNLQFWAYGNGGAGSTIAVSALVSGVWTLVDTVSIAQNDSTNKVALNPQTTQLKFMFTKSVNCGFDDVVVQGSGAAGSIVADATTAALTYAATGLVMETTYYVRARMLTTGEWSTVVSATTASPAPEMPVFGANPGPLSVTTGVARAFTVSATGVPAPVLALAGTTAATGYVFTAGTGQLTYTAPAGDLGAQSFTFTASNTAGVATQVVSVTVLAVAPVFGANPGPLTATATLARVFMVSATGNPAPALALAGTTASSGYSFTAGTGQLSYTPPTNDAGAQTFTFTASNAAGVATQTVSVTVAGAPSYIPTVTVTNIGTNSFTADWTEVTDAATYQVQIATDTNFSGATAGSNLLSESFATLTATTPPSGWSSSISNNLADTTYYGAASPAYRFGTTGQALTSPTFATGATNLQFWGYGRNGTGTYVVSGLVSGVWTLIDTVTIARNGAIYNVPLDSQTTRIKFTFIKSGSVNCRLDDILVQGAATAGSLLLDETVAALTYGATGLDLLTAYYVRVRAAPTGTWSAIVQATTLGNTPLAPWFTGGAGPYSTTAGVAVAFTVSAMGVPTPVLALTGATAAAGSYAFTTNTGYFLYTPPAGDAGTQTFTFTASNATGVATQIVSVSVAAATAPVFDPLGTQYATTGVTKVFYVSATGIPPPLLGLAGTTATTNYTFSPELGRLSYTAPTNDAGTQTFTFTASNVAGVVTQAVSVVVSNMPAVAPVIDLLPPQSTVAGLSVEYTVTATDPDTAASNLTFACTSAVNAATWAFDTNTGYFLFMPTTNQLGTNIFSFQATDHPTSLTSPWSNLVVVVSAVGDAVAVSFGAARYTGEEGGGTVAIPVNLAFSGSAAVQIRFSGPTNGTARWGTDFNCTTTLVVSGASSSNLMISVVNDNLAEGPESIKIQLAPVSPATAGSVTQTVLHIRDDDTVSIMAANTTSGSNQEYEGPGNRIFQALCPDVVLIQEFNVTNGTTAAAYRAWVDQNFGTNFQYYVQSGVSIPNGVISRWPITSAGVWDDTTLSDRDFVWAKIDLPGDQNLNAVSVHIKASSGYESQRTAECRAITNNIISAGMMTNGYVVIGGDFNLQVRTETALSVLTSSIVRDTYQSADQAGDKETNSGRDKPYDLVLPSTNLNARHRSFAQWGYTYANGLVYDTRITWANGLPPPGLAADSGAANMQHMAVLKVFELEKDAAVDAPQAFSATPAGAGQIDLAFTPNSLGDDVIMVWDTDGTFTAPTGTAPAVGAAFAGGTVLYKGSVSPQSHTGLTSCATYHYQCWSYAGTVYSETGLTATAATTEPAAPASLRASATNTLSFTAAWGAAVGATAYRLDVGTVPSFSGAAAGWGPVFRESMGTSAGTTLLADHEAADGFDNDNYTMSEGGADHPADVRTTSASSNYVDSAGNTASGGANIYFTTTGVSGAVGFGIEGIDTRGYEALSLDFGYRKDSATTNMLIEVEWSVNGGASWNPIAVSNLPATNAPAGWYMVTNLAVSASALNRTNLSLRWLRTSNSVAGRLDDILLQGYSSAAALVPGYSNRTVSGATSQSVTGLLANATYYFRVAAIAPCTGVYSSVASVTTLGNPVAPAFGANPGPIGATVSVATAFTVSASGNPVPDLALQGTTASSGYSFTAGTGELSYTPTTNDIGSRTFTFTASNDTGVATQTVSVTVSDLPAEAPAFGANPGPLGATTSVAMAFTVTATGYPGPALALQSTTASGGHGFTPATGQLTYTPPGADVGTQSFTFTASNGAGVATQTVSVSVAAGIPAAPAALWASATNTTDFTAAWSASLNATGYRLDVSTTATFQVGSGVGVQSLLASNAATSPALITNEWSGAFLGGSTYLIMTQSTSVVTSPAFSTVGFTNLTVDFRARTYGGASGTSSNITVSISTNDGAAWTVLGVVSPSSSTMSTMPTLTNTANLGFSQTRIRWQTLGATGTIGAGVSNLIVRGWSLGATPSFVPGYSNRTVAGTGQSVTGLTANSTYYFRVRAENGAGTSGSSATASVTTREESAQDQTIDFPAIGAQVTTSTVTLAATASSGLAVSFAVGSGPGTISGGTNLAFTGAGTVSIVASQAGNSSWNPAPDVTNTFAVTKAAAGVTLTNLAQTYDGAARTVTATTLPGGLTVELTYNGSASAPTAAGSYAVTGMVNEAMYQGSATGTLVVAKASATVALGNLEQTYSGAVRTVSATTTPAGLTVAFTYDGSAAAPTNAGSYAVTGTVNEANYAGSASGTLVVSKAAATVSLGSLAQTYDGTARMATATTTPEGLTVDLTYDGLAWAPTNAGSYAVTGTVADVNYAGSSTATLEVAKADQLLDFPTIADQVATNAVGLSATADSGLTVSFTVISGPASIAGGTTLTFTGAGTVSIAASQAGDDNWNPAAGATNLFNVSKAPATVELGNLTQAYDGTARIVTATTVPVGLSVDLTYDGHAWAPTNAGSYAVTGTVSAALYQGSTSGVLVVSQASESATVTLGSLAQTYDGTPRAATATTDPEGLTVVFTYDGSPTAPTDAGSYVVTGLVSDLNYTGSATGTLVVAKAVAAVTLADLAQTYDGTARAASAATVPEGLDVVLTYDGSATVPTHAGTYAVTGTVDDANYAGATNGTLVVAKAAAAVTLSNLAQDYDGSPKSATASTVPAGLTVAITYDGSPTAPSATGSYAVVATVVDGDYAGATNGTLVIAQALTPFQLWVRDEQGQSLADPNFTTNADYDNDGMTTWEEYLADTDPATNGSVLVLTGRYYSAAAVGRSTGEIRFSFPASTNRFYQLEYCTRLTNSATIGVTNLGRGLPNMVVTNRTTGTWYGVIRVLLSDPGP